MSELVLLWALCFPLITVGIALSPHLTFAALRAFLAGAALVTLGFILGRPMPKGARIWAMLILMGLGATSLGYLGMFHAAEFVSPGIATVIANSQPLLADTAGGYALGGAYIVLAALGITVSNVLIKRIAGEVDAIMAVGIQMLVGGVPLALGAWVLEDPGNIAWSPLFVLVLVSLSLFGSALVYWLWFSVLERVPLNQANAFSFLIPVFGLSMGVLFYGESMGWLKIGGIGLTLLGIAVVNRTTGKVIEGAARGTPPRPAAADPGQRRAGNLKRGLI